MFVFYYQIRNPFAPSILEGEVFAKNKADAFNQVVELGKKELNSTIESLQVTLQEVAQRKRMFTISGKTTPCSGLKIVYMGYSYELKNQFSNRQIDLFSAKKFTD